MYLPCKHFGSGNSANRENFIWNSISLRSKRFRGVGEQRKTKQRYFARAKLGREQNKKEGVGEGTEGNACRQTPGFLKPPFASERGS